MSQPPLQTEAIVLKAFPFKEYDRILTLFTPAGLLKLFAKGTRRNYLQTIALTSPLTCGEYSYIEGRNDLHRFSEGKILSQHLAIRDCFETLQAAERLIQAVLTSQWPGKSAPKLYSLFRIALEHLPKTPTPSFLVTLFLLKILRHEGLLQLPSSITSTYRYGGECYLQEEAPRGAVAFSEEEESSLIELSLSRSLKLLRPQTPDFQQKISTLFSQVFEDEKANREA